jgi:two-component system sensor histidine kinase/response regulator
MNKLKDKSTFNILIVDDVPRNIQIVGNILRKEGYQIAFAQNGKAALERVHSDKFDLILLDIMMPEMDGFEVCEKIVNDPVTSDIPVIFLTAKADIDSTIKGFSLGAVDYITKPFNGVELLARVETHLALKRSREVLAETNAAKDKFYSIIAHDLKNPVGAFKNVSYFLNDEYDNLTDEEKREFILMMRDSSKNLVDLLENLLQWSRSQTGRINFQPDIVDISSLVQSNIDLMKMTADKKNIKLINNFDKSITIFADMNMINTVLRNLISNAIKFTPFDGSITIDYDMDDESIKVKVRDTGVGISPENIEKIFKIDSTHTTAGTQNESGTGLGLILCREFIEKHGGEMNVESEINKGSEFYFTLPINDPDDQ